MSNGFVEDLEFFLDQGMDAYDIARSFRVAGPAAIERRLSRLEMTESPLAERFRATKPGYCSNCRRTEGKHRAGCPSGLSTKHTNRPSRARSVA